MNEQTRFATIDCAYVSTKFRYFAFAAMIGVILLHCGDYGSAIYDYSLSYVTRCAVPWFAISSGVFFAVSIDKYALKTFVGKRVTAVFVPYVFGVVFGLSIWALRILLTGGEFDVSVLRVARWFGIPQHTPAMNPPMWFLRSLFAFSLILSVIHKITMRFIKSRTVSRVVISAVFSVVIFLSEYMHFDFIFGTYTTPFYFLLGYLVSERIVNGYERLDGRVAMSMSVIFFIAFVMLTILHQLSRGCSSPIEIALRNGAIMTFICFAWLVYDQIFVNDARVPGSVVRMSFFPFLIHYPLVYSLYALAGKTLGGNLFFCMAAPLFTLGLIGAGLVLKKQCPAVFSFVTGGR